MLVLKNDLEAIKPFEFSIGKCFEVGNLLKCYYGIFDIEDHRRAIAYAVGFDSYLNLVSGLNMGLNAGYLGRGTFIQDKEDTDKESTSSNGTPSNGTQSNGTPSDNGTSSKKTQFVNQIYPTHAELDEKVPNTMDLSANIIITGPNASGKTTQLKTTAINIILTQQFGVGFYTSCELVPYTHIHSYLNIPDTSGRDSLFQAEARRCKEILDVVATSDTDSTRHFCVFDELFSGTNAEEATSASFGFLKYLQGFANVDFILTTQFVKLCQKVEKDGALRITNYMMDAELCDKEIVFTYDMIPGISKIKAAKLILIQMGFPDEIISGMV
jgi:energy-coupling factor transporter ATP-binding protein EcfA2